MKKIPILDTVRYAYSFTFGHLGTIIGLIWLPMVITVVAGYFVMSHYYASVPDAVSAGNATAAGQAGLLLLGWSLVSLLLSSIMYVAVTRQALGLRHGPAVVYFALGPAEFRVFGAVLGFFAIAIFFLMVDLLLINAARTLAAKIPMAGAAVALFAVVLLCGVAYALVRLSFLLIPATVAEQHVGLGRAWELSGRNFWRITAVGIAVLGPITLVAVTAQVAIMGPATFLHNATGVTHDTAQQMKDMAAQMRDAAKHLPALYGLSFLMAPFFMGLALSGSAFAYRALTSAGPANSGLHETA
jgi:hypothetical protein